MKCKHNAGPSDDIEAYFCDKFSHYDMTFEPCEKGEMECYEVEK